jgi:hypothetical protein
MAQREWVEKDFYKELGVSSDAARKEIKRVAARSSPTTIRTGTRAARRKVQGRRRKPKMC